MTFTVQPADIDETVNPGEAPADYVERMAREKAAAVPNSAGGVLAADTAVVIDQDILGKPRDRMDALAMLARLGGRWHSVYSAVALATGNDCHSIVVETRVEFIPLTRTCCESYLDTDEPWDKAGAYGIQGLGGAFVQRIDGSYSNVVGLPLCETRALLTGQGIQTRLEAHQ